MARHKKKWAAVLGLLLVGVFAVVVTFQLPDAVSQITYAVERGQSNAAREHLRTADDLSGAFKSVAKSLRPSVVSISSVKHTQVMQRQMRPFAGSRVPDVFRRYFGEDLLDGFSFEGPLAPRRFEQRGLGTGVIVSEDGYIVTNNHVIAGADEVKVTLSDNRQLDARIVGTDQPTDLAVLKIEANNLQPAEWGDSSRMEVGDWVLAIGSPFGLDQTVTAGIVSAKGRANVGITDYEDFIQSDAAINPGNSGGPLVNLQGDVIGINTAIASRNGGNMGVGFAIPSDMAVAVMKKLVDHGRVERGFLGAMIQELNEDLAASFGYDKDDGAGVLIGDVLPEGPAAKAGLKPGDIVTRFDGKRMTSPSQLRNAVASTPAGTTVTLEVVRDGKRGSFEVEVGRRESSVEFASRQAASSSDLGVTVKTLTPDVARQLGYDESLQGVIVTEVESGSTAAAAGIRPRDLILLVDGEKIVDAAAFREAMTEKRTEAGVRIQSMRDGIKRFLFIKPR